VAATACAAAGLLALAPAWAAQPVQAQPVAAGVWVVQGDAAPGSSANRNFFSNAGFVVTPQGVVVIDALGSPALANELIAAIRRVTAQSLRVFRACPSSASKGTRSRRKAQP